MRRKFLIGGIFIFLILLVLPAAVQGQECDETPPSPSGTCPPELAASCADLILVCNLMINTWDPSTHISPDIRIADPLNTPTLEDVRFYFDSTTNSFYTKLYSKFYNIGDVGACADAVTIHFYYKETNDPAAAYDLSGWQSIGTYPMNIPTSPGAFFPDPLPHYQQVPVCWYMPAPRVKFPSQFILKAEIEWGLDEDLANYNNEAFSFYDLTTLKREAHIAFALDLSGSMNTIYSDTNTRLDIAKEKAGMFVFLVDDNQYLGVYGFATGNPNNTSFTVDYTSTTSGDQTGITLSQTSEISPMQFIQEEINGLIQRSNIHSQITDQSAYGCTPVGQGLLRGKKGLEWASTDTTSSLTPSKAIVLFSDGLQNVPPFVNLPPSYTCGSYPPNPDIDATETFAANDITLYYIYFGPDVGWTFAPMSDILESEDQFVYGTADELELAAIYFAIRGMVDDMVYLEEDGLTSASVPWPQFEVNFDEAANDVTAAVAWHLGDGKTRLTIDYRKKGDTQWTTYQEPVTTTAAPTGSTPLSFKVIRFTAGPNTTWEFRVRQISPRVGQTKYTAAVFSDVAQAQFKAYLNGAGFETGNPLSMYVDLRSVGHPIIGADVTATVKVPTRSFGSTLRKYFNKFSPGQTQDTNRVSTIVPQLKEFLKQDVGSEDIYVYKDVVLTLKDNGIAPDEIKGDGRYTAVLSTDNTHTAGDYEVTFTASGTLSSGRTFKRSTKLSTICDVGPVDIEKSAVEMSVFPPRPDSTRLVDIVILPTDKYGNAAFPGSGNKIRVSSKGGTLKGGIIDNQDSSFTQQLVLQPGETAEVDVSVGGVSLGTVTTERPLLCHELSLHAGTVTPEGLFDEIVSSGRCLAFDYTYRLNHNFGIRGELGLNWFNDRFNDKLLLTNLNTYLQYRYLSGRAVPYFETGPGFYKLENSSSAIGYGAGVGMMYILSRRWNLDFNVHGHRVGGKLDLSFIQVLAGIIYKF